MYRPDSGLRKDFDQEGTALIRMLLTDKGVELTSYRDQDLKHILKHMMKKAGIPDLNEYCRFLLQNPREFENVLIGLIGSHQLGVDDAELFQTLKEEVIPLLVLQKSMKGEGRLKIWASGVSGMITSYRLAILFRELLGEVIDNYSVDILTSVSTEDQIAQANDPRFSPSDIESMTNDIKERYFHLDGDHLRPCMDIKKMVKVLLVDPASGPWPKGVDLVISKEGFMNLPKGLRTRRMRHFHRSLNEGGFLLMNDRMVLNGELSIDMRLLGERPGFYQKNNIHDC
ncbi:MAG: hypothetical protein MIO87_02720 [Methanomassiliicoccales archaeon]|nr:hypothetical protein [Methanomassiliicoccales archaeon]TFG56845.1 MAG: hypothetical protein E4H30_02635 [Methanomassiliicoccus sp.]